MRTSDFDYNLPSELIASRPLERRDASRMMVVRRETGTIEHRHFADLNEIVTENVIYVFNNTRVVRARYFSDDGKIEVLRLEAESPTEWRCLVKPGKKMRVGNAVTIGGVTGEVTEMLENGERRIRFASEIDETSHGHLALPHYMERDDEPDDIERYQTVYADPSKAGAIAAPTAGLHFTDELIATLPHTFLTLHVGVGTFQPVRVEEVADHKMHSERFEVTEESATAIREADSVLAVGTTVARVLEHCARSGAIESSTGETDIFITPGFEFRAVDALLTNFHLPKSTLLMLVSALAGRELMGEAYARAVEERYRFFSYGDCMLIL